MRKLICTVLLILSFSFQIHAEDIRNTSFDISFSEIIVQYIPSTITIINTDTALNKYFQDTTIAVLANNQKYNVHFKDGEAQFDYTFDKSQNLEIRCVDSGISKRITPIPLWMSIFPPLIAILFALAFREVFSALFVGLLVGTTIISYYQGNVLVIAIFKGIFILVDTYIIESMSDMDHLSIIIFSMLIGAMVNLITRNGGMKGVVNILSRHAKTSRSGQFVTWLMGILIFFDDYANTLVVGNTMKPMTDRLKISREKLAYLVDSTAAPIAAIAFVTTWIGAELSYIQDGIDTIGLDATAYSVFLNSLAYSFYPVLALLFILMLVFTDRDFGPMYKAEKKIREKGIEGDDTNNSFSNQINELEVPDDINARWYNAVIPVLVIIFGTLAGLLYTGWDQDVWLSDNLSFSKKISHIIGNSDSYTALLWSSISGVLTAVVLTISQRILKLKACIDSLINGFRTMLTAILILVLAWSLALVTQHMHTADFISSSMLELSLSPYFVPALTFILAALISFSTGSSWGTMAILYPLILPASWMICKDYGLDHNISMNIFYNVVSSVLAGSVLGDHCSPISDTTILSSLASSCNHIEHVRTQLPYALTVGTVAVVIGTIPSAYGVSTYILFPVSLIILFLLVRFIGRKNKVYRYN